MVPHLQIKLDTGLLRRGEPDVYSGRGQSCQRCQYRDCEVPALSIRQ